MSTTHHHHKQQSSSFHNNDYSSHSLSQDYTAKDNLYSLYYELTSEIKGEKIELDEEEYEENLRNTSLNQIANYIRESIMILIQKYNPKKINKVNPTNSDISQYEVLLRYNEAKQRQFIKTHFMHRLQREALENRIEDYMEMEDEFEEMRTKLKYEDGKFLENDRKDNEILIIRAENTNLKNIIQEKENAIKLKDDIILQKDNMVNELNNKIGILSKKLEKTEKELNLFSNINININNNNNTHNNNNNNNTNHINNNNNNNNNTNNITNNINNHNNSNSHNTSVISSPLQHNNNNNTSNNNNNNNLSSKCVFCAYNNNISEMRGNSQIKLLNLKNLKPQTRKIHNDILNPAVVAGQNNFTSKSCKSASNSHQRNNSMNMFLDKKKVDLISKYFSNKNKNNKSFNSNYYKKINASNVNISNTNQVGMIIPLNISQLSNRNCCSSNRNNSKKNFTGRESGNNIHNNNNHVIHGYIGSKSNKNKNAQHLLIEKKLNHVKKQNSNNNQQIQNLCNRTSINYSHSLTGRKI